MSQERLGAALGALVLGLFAATGWSQQALPATNQDQPAATIEEAPLSNAEVIKLCGLELGDEVVIAKINQVPQVDFQLDTDSLVELKTNGVSREVIAAMLKRSTPQPAQPDAASAQADNATGSQPQRAGALLAPEDQGVLLRTTQGEQRLQSVLGDVSMTYVVVAHLMFLDFPGLEAEVRVDDHRPTIIVHSSKSPRGRVYLVRCDQDEDDDVRSVKLGKAGMFSAKSWTSPDRDWTVDCESTQAADGTWEITPKQDLAPGEYGVLFRGGLSGALGGTQGELFDFGVE